ncbi:MAG: dinitrogenase iron-molybdenum cofactor biosynthesis protein [Chloroflexi bacterium]|nr:MAG: dinitrogenase iron-molybdenum cofactor biosynthesis protein [Chloroflexota bacterium]MBL1195500.1 dinitrogenase iron-molybdenum cofactor biosynthesis protein [Chloroflexota bacterium]NOH12782.1 dinitrogenase iron-molybdenum cofactor biosynthesis protein [Chloroflexota bacterium]
MKIAIVTDDGKTISVHFGRAAKYDICEVEDGKLVSEELIDKLNFHGKHQHKHDLVQIEHQDHEQGHGFGKEAEDKHQTMFSPILDCDLLLARGMGMGAHRGLEQANIRPIITDISVIHTAVEAVITGEIVDHRELLH